MHLRYVKVRMNIHEYQAKAVLRERMSYSIPREELVRLLVEMCSTRGLAVIFDERELTPR